jgi:capsid protein
MAQGKDVKEHLQQYKQDMDALDELGIKLDSDPRVALEAKRPVESGGTNEE